MARVPAKVPAPPPPPKRKRTPRHVDWIKARAEWEADPAVTYGTLAKRARITKQAVAKRAKREGWTRVDPNESAVRKAIRQRADAKSKGVRPAAIEGEVLEPQEPPSAPGLPSLLGTSAAIEARAELLDRHRREWNVPRNRMYKAVQENNFEGAKLAKIAAETFSIIQAGERKAWALDSDPVVFVRVIESRRDECD